MIKWTLTEWGGMVTKVLKDKEIKIKSSTETKSEQKRNNKKTS